MLILSQSLVEFIVHDLTWYAWLLKSLFQFTQFVAFILISDVFSDLNNEQKTRSNQYQCEVH